MCPTNIQNKSSSNVTFNKCKNGLEKRAGQDGLRAGLKLIEMSFTNILKSTKLNKYKEIEKVQKK